MELTIVRVRVDHILLQMCDKSNIAVLYCVETRWLYNSVFICVTSLMDHRPHLTGDRLSTRRSTMSDSDMANQIVESR